MTVMLTGYQPTPEKTAGTTKTRTMARKPRPPAGLLGQSAYPAGE